MSKMGVLSVAELVRLTVKAGVGPAAVTSGDVRFASEQCKAIHLARRFRSLGTVQDITERQEMKKELERTRAAAHRRIADRASGIGDP